MVQMQNNTIAATEHNLICRLAAGTLHRTAYNALSPAASSAALTSTGTSQIGSPMSIVTSWTGLLRVGGTDHGRAVLPSPGYCCLQPWCSSCKCTAPHRTARGLGRGGAQEAVGGAGRACSGSVKLAMVMKSFQPRLVLSPVLLSAAKRPKLSRCRCFPPLACTRQAGSSGPYGLGLLSNSGVSQDAAPPCCQSCQPQSAQLMLFRQKDT